MVYERGTSSGCSVLAVANEAASAIAKGASLPDIVGRCCANNYVGAFCGEELGGVDEVGLVS